MGEELLGKSQLFYKAEEETDWTEMPKEIPSIDTVENLTEALDTHAEAQRKFGCSSGELNIELEIANETIRKFNSDFSKLRTANKIKNLALNAKKYRTRKKNLNRWERYLNKHNIYFVLEGNNNV